MSSRGWPMLLAVTVAACTAVACGVYLLSGGNDIQLVVIVLALTIGFALAAVVLGLYMQSGHMHGHLRQIRGEIRGAERSFREGNNRTEYLATQILELRQRGDQASVAIMSGLQDLKASYATLADQMRSGTRQFVSNGFGGPTSFTPPPPQAFNFAPPPAMPTAANEPGGHGAQADHGPFSHSMAQSPPAAPAAPLLDQLSTSLEPIVDLFTGKTSHYRLHLGMSKPGGEEVSSDVLLHHADRTGLRAGFDVHAARDALGLLRRLRHRDSGLSIFLPLGAATLQSEHALDRLINLREEFSDVADGLVLEIPHSMLAGLPDSGLEGLAQLARFGHCFSLSNISISGVDLPSLSKLNVRYVTLNAASATGADGPPAGVAAFAQSARSLRVNVIVTNVADMRMVPVVSKVSRYASGPAFAEPRRVKAEAAAASPGFSAVA